MTKDYTYDDNYISAYELKAPQYDTMYHDLINATRYQKVAQNTYAMMRKENVATITCVGDMLCEEKLYKAHCDGQSAYFHDVFQFVHPIFKKSDLVIGNLETCVVKDAPYTGEQYKIEGRFHNNAPQAFLDAIREAGFDFLIMANNHSLDCGLRGALETIDRVEEAGMMHTGLFRPEETAHYTIAEVNGIRVAVLAYSTWFNRLQDNLTEEGKEKILSIYSPQRAQEDIAAAKAAGAEFVLVYMHWGVDAEYKSAPSDSMKRMAQEVATAGADYIVGSHPHSLMPYGVITTADGRRVPLIWSMGNFVTSEYNKLSRETGILQIQLQKAGGKVSIISDSFTPCYVPDSFCGIGYPVVPKSCTELSSELKETLAKGCSHASAVVGECRSSALDKFTLNTNEICDLLGVSSSLPNTTYTGLAYAMDAVAGCVALIRSRAFDPYIYTSEKECIRIADYAISKGAKLLLADRQIKDYPCLVVPEPFEAYSAIIAAIRRNFKGHVLGVTGSIGKTSTTGMLDAVIRSKYKTFSNLHNANSARYSAKLIQQLTPEYEAYVQEIMETPPYGLAGMISKMVQPHVAIVTVVGTSHLKALGSQERIRETCLSVADGMDENGVLILNGDDPFQKDPGVKQKVVYYAVDNHEADYYAENIRGGDMCMLFDIVYKDPNKEEPVRVPIRLHCFGKHNVLNAVATFVAGKHVGLTDEEIAKGLAQFQTMGIRQNLVRYGSRTVFLDCYNAAAESMQSAFNSFSMIPLRKGGRRIAILGDIKETGVHDEVIHKQVGEMIPNTDVDVLVCFGESAKIIAETARTCTRIPVIHSTDFEEIKRWVLENVTPDDLLLLKGSRGMALERFADALLGTWFYESDEDALAVTKTVTENGLRFRVYPDHATLIAKPGSQNDVVIPNEVNGVPVTGINNSTFTHSNSYTNSVVLPDTLKNIRYCAFYCISNLTEVEIPASVRLIDKSAFSTCKNLTKVTIQNGCQHLGYRAFGNCVNLEEIVIPPSVQQIDGEAFLNCSKLTIYGEKKSFAESYAKKMNIPFSRVHFK